MANELIISRIFDAPRETVWKVWTSPEHIAKWFGPEGFDTRVEKCEMEVGGKLKYIMIDADGKEYPTEGTVKEIIEPEKLVSTDEFGEDFEGEDLPQGMITTVLFEEIEGKTKVTIQISHPTEEDKKKNEAMGVVGGWNSSLDKVEEVLKTI